MLGVSSSTRHSSLVVRHCLIACRWGRGYSCGMAPIWGRYGPFFLYGYSVVLGLGVMAALAVTAWRARRKDTLPNPLPLGEGTGAWLDGALTAAGGALVGGRAVYVWLNAAYFAENPTETAQVWLGGLNYHGALVGGLAALWLWARLSGRPFLRHAALFAPGLALLVAFGWAACAVEGCAFGRAAPPGLWAGDLPDDTGVFALRYRTQIGGVVGALAVFAVVWWAAARLRPAALVWTTLGGLAVVHIVVALGRGDPSRAVLGVRLDFLMELGLLAVASIAIGVDGLRKRSGQ